MGINAKLYEDVRVLGVIDPDAYAANSYSTGWIAAADYQRFMAIVMAGDLGTSATLDAKIEEATSAAGAGAQDCPGKAIAQLTQAGTDSNKQSLIHVGQEDLSEGFTHFRLTITVAVATSDAGGLVVGVEPTRSYQSQAATVDEMVD
jgi:hypothetical protein